MKIIWLMGVIGLSGCSPYDNKFDCPYGPGMGCTALSTVDKLVDQDQLNVDADLRGSAGTSQRVFVYFGGQRRLTTVP